MKAYKYIVLNKNNMKELKHFSKMGDVINYVLGKSNQLVIVNEMLIAKIDKEWNYRTIESVLHSMDLEN